MEVQKDKDPYVSFGICETAGGIRERLQWVVGTPQQRAEDVLA